MKKLVVLLFILIGAILAVKGQKTVPENIKKDFQLKYPEAKAVKWDNEGGKEWEAEFQMNGKDMSTSYDLSGKWLESETAIAFEKLPSAARNIINNEYIGYKTVEILILENPQMKGYEVALKKGESRITIIFKNDGTVLRRETSGK